MIVKGELRSSLIAMLQTVGYEDCGVAWRAGKKPKAYLFIKIDNCTEHQEEYATIEIALAELEKNLALCTKGRYDMTPQRHVWHIEIDDQGNARRGTDGRFAIIDQDDELICLSPIDEPDESWLDFILKAVQFYDDHNAGPKTEQVKCHDWDDMKSLPKIGPVDNLTSSDVVRMSMEQN